MSRGAGMPMGRGVLALAVLASCMRLSQGRAVVVRAPLLVLRPPAAQREVCTGRLAAVSASPAACRLCELDGHCIQCDRTKARSLPTFRPRWGREPTAEERHTMGMLFNPGSCDTEWGTPAHMPWGTRYLMDKASCRKRSEGRGEMGTLMFNPDGSMIMQYFSAYEILRGHFEGPAPFPVFGPQEAP